ncbi:amidase [Ornithinimicrobium cryptoxanthini]|uniref:Amidase n=1 Tax=Ornithinimicrobium cryptoxanthini TaxID=2934161 RepID=A0ABY4YLU7_9MICO|nr:amidase [Ornithinimicrobium cryptoxanthini]USQ77584.1 amidase [Ornithinimicrobium cryptoxanthini]
MTPGQTTGQAAATDQGSRPGAGLSMRSATELVAGFADGSIDPVAVTHDALAAIEAHDEQVNAMVLVDAEGALEAARASARRWEQGSPLGPADGVPTTIKDILLTRGWPTLRGSRLIEEAGPWPDDAPAVARLRESGSVLLGKNTAPEFAWKGVTDSLRHGATGNPWGAELTAGGSSGGAAAAVGLGMGVWAPGTDGGGSVRIPASFTGTVALKGTYGRVPMFPSSPYGTVAHAGPMTRSVRDAAFLLDILSGPDSRDWSAEAPPTSSFLEGLDAGVRGLRIAFSPTLGFDVTNDPEVEAAVRAAAEILARAGAEVEEIDPGIDDPVDAFHVLWFTGAAKVLEGYGPGAIEQIDPGLAEAIRSFGLGVSASHFLDAVAVRMDLGRTMGAFHETHDVLLTPTMPIAAFPVGQPAPDGWASDLWTSWTPYTYPFNLTQQPALSVPCGFTADERPVGLQVVGARHADALVLRVGQAYEALTDWHRCVPTLLRHNATDTHHQE